ncbi:MAG: phosphodiesterase [Clostridia bacterium]|nr:phosphodiesterase [Clostridia bacterium]
MKLMIASDLHGAAPDVSALLQAFDLSGADKLVLLGDLLYHGPRNDLPDGYAPKKVIELLSACKNRLLCVRGNCEAEVDQMVLPFPVMAEYAVLHVCSRTIYATHGHNYGPDRLPPLQMGDALLSGHTHVPTAHEKNGLFFLNPGSVSIPKNNTPKSYAMLENGVFTVYELMAHTPYLSITM